MICCPLRKYTDIVTYASDIKNMGFQYMEKINLEYSTII